MGPRYGTICTNIKFRIIFSTRTTWETGLTQTRRYGSYKFHSSEWSISEIPNTPEIDAFMHNASRLERFYTTFFKCILKITLEDPLLSFEEQHLALIDNLIVSKSRYDVWLMVDSFATIISWVYFKWCRHEFALQTVKHTNICIYKQTQMCTSLTGRGKRSLAEHRVQWLRS